MTAEIDGIDGRPADWGALVAGVLDGTLGDADRARISAAIAASPALAREMARAALLHDAIERELVAGDVGRRSARRVASIHAVRRWTLAASVLLAAVLGTWAFLRTTPSADAAAVVARFATVHPTSDRTYRISAPDVPERADPAGTPARGGRQRLSLDGALLHLRGDDAWVIIRRAADGTQTVTGSDGRTSWNAPADGAVRVSADPRRFRGALPGARHDVPFVGIPSGLASLASNYDLQFGPTEWMSGRRVPSIHASRRSDAEGGPRDVTIWYDADTLSVLRIRLDHLPQAQGGPRTATLDLVSEEPLGADFFDHAAHHAPGRDVLRDD